MLIVLTKLSNYFQIVGLLEYFWCKVYMHICGEIHSTM